VALNLSAALEVIPFQDPASARAHLAHMCAGLSSSLAGALPGLLAEAPDPDSAVLLFDRLITESGAAIRELFERHNFLAHLAIAVFGHSRYLSETLLQTPELLASFADEKTLDRSFSHGDFEEELSRFRSRVKEYDLATLLARFKRQQYVRIMLRDVLNISALAETTSEISILSDVLIEAALKSAQDELQHRYEVESHSGNERPGQSRFAILALGKLGGSELNYNSDVDLIYLYDDVEEKEGPISQHQYFVRLGQKVTEILGRVTREGPVFRIDLRLRPQGMEGELAVSLSHCRRYYAEVAQDWEQQALIKARYSAGDVHVAREFLVSVQPHVYRREVNFAAIKTALVAREKMQSKRRIAGGMQGRLGIDVKLDRGGIRDIEFLVQCLQRVYGGAEPWLRSSGTLAALHKLHDKGHLSGQEFHILSSAYEFLRRVEHFLQLRQGLQTHRLPDQKQEVAVLRRAVAGFLQGERLQDISSAIQARMAAVSEIYRRVIYQQESGDQKLAAEADFQLRGDAMVRMGFDEPMLQRLAADAPAIFQLTRRRSLHPETRKNLIRFLSSVFTSSQSYGVLLRHTEAFESALRVFETSGYLTDILIRHPEEVAVLERLPKDTARMGSGELFRNLFSESFASDPVLAYVAQADLRFEEKLAHLRKRYRQRELTNGARDIVESRNVYESLACTTGVAEDAITTAFRIAGAPACLAVLALGRLGTREFDFLSDADLLFVADEGRDMQALTKAAETIMQALAAYTQEGMIFAVDTRLRPHGSQGELVVTLRQLHHYFGQEAQAWEALTYTKLRPIAGDNATAAKALGETSDLFERFAGDRAFAPAVRDMRSKLEDSSASSFKTSPGGTYDIDFLTGYLLVANRIRTKNGTLRDRLWTCAAAGHLAKEDAAALDHAGEFLRTVDHVVRLVEGRAQRWLPRREGAREHTEKLTSQILGQVFPQGLETELQDTLQRVRQIYVRVLG
jgi:[glutamine synthetase] adenylyltransferase / [glutamine synthetase]-adenylyl-L-tyrosine phosphorylase